jgi:mRNA-degrading endonuclease RelE of RelBE toxin-antitoxin system
MIKTAELESLEFPFAAEVRSSACRIRAGDYRVGFYWAGEELIFARALHQREIYRYSP